jgi:alpha-tubulin suppressor-like RCC1 family protein
MRHLKYFLAVSALLAAACSDDSVTARRTPLGLRLSLTPSADTIILGAPAGASTTTLVASATAHSTPVGLPGHVFEAGDSNVVALFTRDSTDSLVTVRPRSVGTSTVTVRVNDERATATIVVLPLVKSISVKASATQALVADTIVLTTTSFGWDGDTVPAQTTLYSSSSPAAIVTPTGRVVFTAPGSATITARNGQATASVVLTALARDFIGGSSTTISSGLDATCGLLPLGNTFCFGRAPLIGVAKDTTCFDDRQASPTGCTLIPLRIAGQLQLAAVTVGDSVACGLNPQGRAYCWGNQAYGQLGNGIAQPGTSALPVAVTGPLNAALTFTQISAGSTHACGVTAAGGAYCWGKDSTFQLGNGDNLSLNSTTPIPVSGGNIYKAIAAGRGHTCALRTDGVALCWGDNRNGQLGRGIIGVPVDAPAPAGSATFAQISARGDNTCGLTPAGNILCWGANESGQTGQAPGAPVTIPTQVAGSNYTTVSVGGLDSSKVLNQRLSHTCALSSGSAVCWGANEYGQLGRGTFGAPSSIPQAVPGRAFTAITAVTRTTCAVAIDGAYCWGSSILGAMGSEVQALKLGSPQKTAVPR